jgi:hypothetical protein
MQVNPRPRQRRSKRQRGSDPVAGRDRQQLSVIVASDVVDELRDGAVAMMGDGVTLASLTEEALTIGLETLRSRHFGGKRPPPRTIQPRPGRRLK